MMVWSPDQPIEVAPSCWCRCIFTSCCSSSSIAIRSRARPSRLRSDSRCDDGVEPGSADRDRTELLVPMYLYLLLFFFLYCYPIARATIALEKRFQVR